MGKKLYVGNLPFSDEIKDRHYESINERCLEEAISLRKKNYLLVERDVLEVARGKQLQWPITRARALKNKFYACR